MRRRDPRWALIDIVGVSLKSVGLEPEIAQFSQ
jgi:hypothetical protein